MKKGLAAVLAAAALGAAVLLCPGAPVDVSIPPGLSTRQTSALLSQKGVVVSARLFRLAAHLCGADRGLKPGAYKLRRRMWLPALLAALEAGGSQGVKIIVPEGFRARQIAERLEANGVCKASEFERYAAENRLEGYLFPTTYFFEPGAAADAVAHRMYQEFKKRIQPEFDAASPKPALTMNQLLTLASIVEREAVLSQEKPMIAAVYLNRMRIRMRLEADPTVQYALGFWKKGMSVGDLRTPSPYNTYIHYGLPPGPICSPGVDSFRAALRPASTDALYFVADTTGSHVFSATLQEHLEAKRSYKKVIRAEKAQMKKGARQN